jgi:hypothetical protein
MYKLFASQIYYNIRVLLYIFRCMKKRVLYIQVYNCITSRDGVVNIYFNDFKMTLKVVYLKFKSLYWDQMFYYDSTFVYNLCVVFWAQILIEIVKH